MGADICVSIIFIGLAVSGCGLRCQFASSAPTRAYTPLARVEQLHHSRQAATASASSAWLRTTRRSEQPLTSMDPATVERSLAKYCLQATHERPPKRCSAALMFPSFRLGHCHTLLTHVCRRPDTGRRRRLQNSHFQTRRRRTDGDGRREAAPMNTPSNTSRSTSSPIPTISTTHAHHTHHCTPTNRPSRIAIAPNQALI